MTLLIEVLGIINIFFIVQGNKLEKLWNEKRDTTGKMTDEKLVDVNSKIRSYPNAGSRIHKIYFLEVLGIGLE